MKEAGEQIGIDAGKSRTCSILVLCLSVALIYNGKAIHLQFPAYLMVTLNHNIKYYCKVSEWDKVQRNYASGDQLANYHLIMLGRHSWYSFVVLLAKCARADA